jgi:predicted dehydrogenase
MGQQHATLISARRDCQLVAVVAPPTTKNAAIVKSLGVPLYSDLKDALEQETIDAAIISSPNSFHFRQTMSCISARIPVLVEKPITSNIDDARELVIEAEKSQVPVLVGHHRTYSPFLRVAEAFLKSPEFGRLVAIRGAALFHKPAKYFKDGTWRTKKGGGPILINLIHEIGLMRYLCGEIKRVVALAGHNIRNFEVEDTVAISFEFSNGAFGTFILSDTAASSKSWEMTSVENPAYTHLSQDNCYHFAGTNGAIDFPTMRAMFYPEGREPSWWSDFTFRHLSFVGKNPLELQLDHFVQVVRDNDQPLVSARDGYLNLQVLDAISRSIESGTVVSLDS